ncbi:MAG TPA: polysaccharide deacetylase family protein [Solirubrobacteraceae bacterium]|nr:polysaccharide deacetylase family protein [Solirubrobacteraceae bacterium]
MSTAPSVVRTPRAGGLWVKALRRVCRRRSVVLGYHGVAESRLRDDLSLLQVSPARFRRQIEALLTAGFSFLTMAELARRAGDGPPEPGLAAITFDDGMRNNHSVALPILREYGIPATVYVTIGFIGGVSPWIGAKGDGAMMRESELRDLVAAGWELGAHTMTHSDLSTLDYKACRREIEESRDELQRIADIDVETFAYPFGRYTPGALAAVRDSGLLAAVTTGSGSWAPYEITRAMIGTLDPWPVILLKLTDRYEPLLRSAPVNLLRQTSKRWRERLRGRQRLAQ